MGGRSYLEAGPTWRPVLPGGRSYLEAGLTCATAFTVLLCVETRCEKLSCDERTDCSSLRRLPVAQMLSLHNELLIRRVFSRGEPGENQGRTRGERAVSCGDPYFAPELDPAHRSLAPHPAPGRESRPLILPFRRFQIKDLVIREAALSPARWGRDDGDGTFLRSASEADKFVGVLNTNPPDPSTWMAEPLLHHTLLRPDPSTWMAEPYCTTPFIDQIPPPGWLSPYCTTPFLDQIPPPGCLSPYCTTPFIDQIPPPGWLSSTAPHPS
ncbi:hypothetical protein NHX12_022287 [Muraenolepis orangiensis]|uniref:Uncharacterized protein n=1 Tax=Muraenolepis orangiensis TaxID=630683 RepID=A0A9Q0EPJ3_9TELE|nr:hypothetical protein NHX12_022287 [Muraenolepis orangiensis]